MESSTSAGRWCLKALVVASALSVGGACAHNPAPAAAVPGGDSATSSRPVHARAATTVTGKGEQLELVRNPQASRGWLVYGKESRRLIAISDTVPDARGLFAIHFSTPK